MLLGFAVMLMSFTQSASSPGSKRITAARFVGRPRSLFIPTTRCFRHSLSGLAGLLLLFSSKSLSFFAIMRWGIHNCRHELETDDSEYEYQKELDKQRAEDNKGAANALTHNEFIYL